MNSKNDKLVKLFNNKWILKKKVSAGAFGVVFIGTINASKEGINTFVSSLMRENNKMLLALLDAKSWSMNFLFVLYIYIWCGRDHNFSFYLLFFSFISPQDRTRTLTNLRQSNWRRKTTKMWGVWRGKYKFLRSLTTWIKFLNYCGMEKTIITTWWSRVFSGEICPTTCALTRRSR